jgi:hypothetical protein
MKWKLVIQRKSVNRIPDGSGQNQLKHIKHSVERNQTFGLLCKMRTLLPEPLEMPEASTGARWLYQVKAAVVKERYRSEAAAQKQFESALAVMRRAANSVGWQVHCADEELEPEGNTTISAVSLNGETPEADQPRPTFVLPVLDDKTTESYFPGVFERDAHIRIVHKSVASFLETNKEERSHVLLYGLPAGCKTTVFAGLKKFYEQDQVERVAMLDATTLTKAGLENWILERSRAKCLPEILCLEEIEKHNPNNLLSLLAIMASGELMRTNSRIGRVIAEAKVLVWATCNDEEQLKAFHKGALWSRFTHQLHCARPSRKLMGKILTHKIKKLPGGSPAWVDPVLNYAYDEVGNDDPRFMVGLLDGREGLLDGSYFSDLRSITQAKQEEEARRGALSQRQR